MYHTSIISLETNDLVNGSRIKKIENMRNSINAVAHVIKKLRNMNDLDFVIENVKGLNELTVEIMNTDERIASTHSIVLILRV